MLRVDADPEAHSHVNALCTVSFKLACGCSVRHNSPRNASSGFVLKRPGATVHCRRHGDVIITRSTLRLVGWDEPGHHPEGWRP